MGWKNSHFVAQDYDTADVTGNVHSSPLGNENFAVMEDAADDNLVWYQNGEPGSRLTISVSIRSMPVTAVSAAQEADAGRRLLQDLSRQA